jgi:hypothetical protein
VQADGGVDGEECGGECDEGGQMPMRCRLRAMAMAAAAARVTKRKGRPMFCLKKSGNTQAAPVRRPRTGLAAVLDVERRKRTRASRTTRMASLS